MSMASFFVRYRFADDPTERTDDGPFDLRRDAIDHRNWFFGHSPDVAECWVENAAGKRTGALLKVGQAARSTADGWLADGSWKP